MPAKLLIYADPDRTDIQLSVVVDGELSYPNELALIAQGGAKALASPLKPPPRDPNSIRNWSRPAPPCTRSPSTAPNKPPSNSVLPSACSSSTASP
jgi:hypothetical protein